MKEFSFELSENTVRDIRADCPNYLHKVHVVKNVMKEIGVRDMQVSVEENKVKVIIPEV